MLFFCLFVVCHLKVAVQSFNILFKEDFERAISSYATECDSVGQMKTRAVGDMLASLTTIDFNGRNKIQVRDKFKFLARVNTTPNGRCSMQELIKQSTEREYLSYSIITDENISRYKSNDSFMLIYEDMPAEAVVHMCPIDSDTDTKANNELNLTGYPSFWYSPKEFDNLTNKIGLYNQVTCKTRIGDKIILPTAILTFKNVKPDATLISKSLGIPIVVAFPQKNAINYQGDLNENVYFNNPKKFYHLLNTFQNHLYEKLHQSGREDLLGYFMQHFALTQTPIENISEVICDNIVDFMQSLEYYNHLKNSNQNQQPQDCKQPN